MDDEQPELDLNLARFHALLEAYEREPTLTNYVRFRRTFGACGTEIARFTEFDPFSIEAELKQFGIDPWLVSGALGGDADELDEFALQIMERLIERETLEKEGNVHLQSRRAVMGDGLIDFLIVAALQAAAASDESFPPSLVVLIGERLCGARPDRYKEYLRTQRQQDAITLAAIKFPGERVSIRRIAALLRVEPSTVSRWFPNGDFQRHVDNFRRSIDALGLRKRPHG